MTHDYEELRRFLRGFVNIGGDPVPYDFGGVIQLMLALLDNLRENALDVELEEIGNGFTDEQAEFFLRLAGYISRRNPDVEDS